MQRSESLIGATINSTTVDKQIEKQKPIHCFTLSLHEVLLPVMQGRLSQRIPHPAPSMAPRVYLSWTLSDDGYR